MKSVVRLRHMCRVFFILGITNLSVVAAIATVLLSPPLAANAHAYYSQGNCPTGWHIDTGNPSGCRPNGYCDTGSAMIPQNGLVTCISSASNKNKCNPGLTWQDPDDARQCLPNDQHCGSASHFDSNLGYCVLNYNSAETYIENHFQGLQNN
ncbi:MAG TPA: hypothetical protein VGL94_02540 [Ktedonobacteraceae bacterium]|jgi:hypothetical protein